MKQYQFFLTVTFAMLMLVIFGLLNIASIQDSSSFVLRQSCFFLAGLGLFAGAAATPFAFFRKYGFYAALFFLLLLLTMPLFGIRIHGMCGWIRIGSQKLHPSELAKVFFLFGTIKLLNTKGSENRRFLRTAIFSLCWTGAILKQPDLGTATVYFSVFLMLLYIANFKMRYIAGTFGAGAICVVLFLLRYRYAWRRITGLLGTTDNWHIRQFALAEAQGGWFGTQTTSAFWSSYYLPLPCNDSAFASLFENIGFVGSAITVSLFALLIGSLCKLAAEQRENPESALFITGAALLISVQALLHIGVNLSLLPPTGINLPFVSYGGSSLVGSCFLLGTALSAARQKSGTGDIEQKEFFKK